MAISDLHSDLIHFAKGSPAFAISLDQIQLDLKRLTDKLKGTFPDKPAVQLSDIELPRYGVAYSSFIQRAALSFGVTKAEVDFELLVNVHPVGFPGDVIRTYEVTSPKKIAIEIDFDAADDVIRWRIKSMDKPSIKASWGKDYAKHLMSTTLPDPQEDNYLSEVEKLVHFMMDRTVPSLVIDSLPRYRVRDFVPWIKFLTPLAVKVTATHLLVMGSKCSITIPGCSPKTIVVDPDPAFPYGQVPPAPLPATKKIDVALYLPKTRIFDFVAPAFEPAILVHHDDLGGSIKWEISGAFGLKSISIDISTGPVLVGVVGIQGQVDFLGVARAWISSCFGNIELARATVIGNGNFGADVRLSVTLASATLDANLDVNKCDVNPNFDFSTPLPPIFNKLMALILDKVAHDKLKEFEQKTYRIARWTFLELPQSYLTTFPIGVEPEVNEDGAAKISALIGVSRRKIGAGPKN
jgi:hypothetical protein